MKFASPAALSLLLACLSAATAFLQPAAVRTHVETAVFAAVGDSFKKADFIAAVAERTGMNKKDSEKALKAVLDVVQEQVGFGKRVSLAGFGTFTLKERAARKGRNPQTGEELQIAASKSPGFTPAKAWKEAVNGPASSIGPASVKAPASIKGPASSKGPAPPFTM